MALTLAQRCELASKIITAIRKNYEKHGVEGDFADGERYLRDDASDHELLREAEIWCRQV